MCDEIKKEESQNCCHEHEHHHDHCHNHDHGHHHHDHDHEHHHHDHSHPHDHSHSHDEDNKDLALLKYMVDHNEHHAEEIANMAKALRDAGKISAAEELEAGVADFECGNAHLSKAYYLLKG